MKNQKIICGDCLKVLPTLPPAKMIFADPPDNLGIKYQGFTDKNKHYDSWLAAVINWGRAWGLLFWLSYNQQHDLSVMSAIRRLDPPVWARKFIWRFTFGQYRERDCSSGFRPLLRINQHVVPLYPDAIRIPSARQTKYNDKRADPRGRVPDDVWEFPRICGTFKERKRWHPCQHPKDLLRRMVLYSTKPGDLVIDMFAGSGNMLEVCKELGRPCIGIDISEFYCQKIAEETGAELINEQR